MKPFLGRHFYQLGFRIFGTFKMHKTCNTDVSFAPTSPYSYPFTNLLNPLFHEPLLYLSTYITNKYYTNEFFKTNALPLAPRLQFSPPTRQNSTHYLPGLLPILGAIGGIYSSPRHLLIKKLWCCISCSWVATVTWQKGRFRWANWFDISSWHSAESFVVLKLSFLACFKD